MKANEIFLLLVVMVSALSYQCSRADDAADELSLPPTRPSEETPDATDDPVTPDSIPDSTTGEGNTGQAVYYNGYANYSNARLVVDSLTVAVAPEFQDEVAWLQGSEFPASKISELLLQDNGSVYVGVPEYPYGTGSLLYAPGWDIPLIHYWNLEYAMVQSEGQPDEVSITGTGWGSHLFGIPYDVWVVSEVTFAYRGIQIGGTNTFEGNFFLEERSPEEKYNLTLSGAATLTWKREGE